MKVYHTSRNRALGVLVLLLALFAAAVWTLDPTFLGTGG
jgi:4-hydroxybenzoate polyprenyltransferase